MKNNNKDNLNKSEFSKAQLILQLEQRVQKLQDQKSKLFKCINQPDYIIQNYLIGEIGKLSYEYFLENQELVDSLSELSIDEIEKLMIPERENHIKYVFLSFYKKSKELYERIFKYFEYLDDEPESFFTNLIDILYLGFNVELFICTNDFEDCRGFIFNLEDGLDYKSKMGIVLTPLAFNSPATFFNTLFHELAHRAYYIELFNNSEIVDKVDHEWHAYFLDKFLQNFFRKEFKWLEGIFKDDIFESAKKLNFEIPNFTDEFFEKSIGEINEFVKILKSYDEKDMVYTHKEVNRMFYRASKMLEINRNYRAIIDFIWFLNGIYSLRYKDKKFDIEIILEMIFTLLIIYSSKYEQKYHSGESVTYGNIIFSPIGELNNQEIEYVKNYCSIMSSGTNVV